MFTECPSKKFGPDCAHNCSGNCLGDVACNKKTGKCDTGCNAGYTGEFCDTGGVKCKMICISKLIVWFFSNSRLNSVINKYHTTIGILNLTEVYFL